MKTLERLFAEKLLKIKAIKLQPANPFTWASGWKSPFYCDNRKTLSYPSLRNFVKIEITRLILERFGQVDAIAGVATGAIPQGALVADALNLPFVYVRSTPKDHGLENLIEGELRPGMKVVVVEDFSFEAPKTKDFVAMTKNLKVSDKKLLVILPEANKNVYLSARNVKGANVQTISGLNTYRVLDAGVVVFAESALSAIDNILM